MPASIRSVEQRPQAGRLDQEGAAHAEGGGREQRVLQQLQGGTLVAVGGDQGVQNGAVHPLANGAQHRGEGGERLLGRGGVAGGEVQPGEGVGGVRRGRSAQPGQDVGCLPQVAGSA